jgi:hypothetical protein
MDKRYKKPDTKLQLLVQKLLVQTGQLPPHSVETCLACKAMKDLRIKNFNNIPSNCMALQGNNFWCSMLNSYE